MDDLVYSAVPLGSITLRKRGACQFAQGTSADGTGHLDVALRLPLTGVVIFHSILDDCFYCRCDRAGAKLKRSAMEGWISGSYARRTAWSAGFQPSHRRFGQLSQSALLCTWLPDERWATLWLLLHPRRGSLPGGSTNRAPPPSWGRASRRLSGRQCWWWGGKNWTVCSVLTQENSAHNHTLYSLS